MFSEEYRRRVEERFFSKITKADDGCWNWNGTKDRKGYGKLSVGGRKLNADGKQTNTMMSAHRLSYILFIGEIPKADGFHGMCVLHMCDNPSCVNPAHLFVGTNADNVHDMDSKGRRVNNQHKGDDHVNSKLKKEDVLAIMQHINDKTLTQKQIAILFGVAHSTINHISKGRLWSHVTNIQR